MSKIDIQTKQKRFETSEKLYGIFLEDINRAVDGGLYPELIRNRSFEDSIPPKDTVADDLGYAFTSNTGWKDEFNHGEGLSRWIEKNNIKYTPIPAWYTKEASIKIDSENTLNKNREAALVVDFDENGLVFNSGFCGIPQKQGDAYHFYMFARADKPVRLALTIKSNQSVEGEKGQRIADITVQGDYQKYCASFVATQTISDGILEISSFEKTQVTLGFVSLMPEDTFLGHGFRKNIAEKLEALSPAFFRFPGGCIVEGFTLPTAMRFKNTVGPVWERPSHQLMWHYRTYNGIGFHEYLQFCEDLDMEPLYVFNCGMTCQARKEILMEGEELSEMLQDTMDALEYALGSVDSKWGSLRSRMGHPEPFKLNYVEIGNENWGEAYEERYMKCWNMIKRKYPHIRCIANSHLEEKGFPVDIVDEHYYDTTEYFAEHTHMFDDYNRKGPEIFLGEVSVVRGYVGQLYGALGEAAFFTGVERNQDIVTLASYAPLLENVHYDAWFPNLIRFNNTESFAIPSYYVWKMFSNHRGNHVVEFSEQTSRIYRPVKGMAALFGKPGVQFKNAVWNGKEAYVSRSLMGEVKQSDNGFIVNEASREQKLESERYTGTKQDRVFVIFGSGEEKEGTFGIDIKTTEDSFEMGIFASPIPKEVYISDETNPPAKWNVGNVKPLLWKIRNGISTLEDQVHPENVILAREENVVFSKTEFQKVSYRYENNSLTLFLNGKVLHDVKLPSFPLLSTVVTDTEKEVIIKMVNMSDTEELVEFTLDCEVLDEYRAFVMAGEKEGENSFENPQNICDGEYVKVGAAQRFTYIAPALSANVLVVQKRI